MQMSAIGYEKRQDQAINLPRKGKFSMGRGILCRSLENGGLHVGIGGKERELNRCFAKVVVAVFSWLGLGLLLSVSSIP